MKKLIILLFLPVSLLAQMSVRGAMAQFTPSLVMDFRTSLPSGVSFSRNSIATRFNASGLLETVAANTPRFDYDPVTLAMRGLLIEEQRTNLATMSETTDGWNNIDGVTTTPNVAIAPTGQSTADLSVIGGNSGEHLLIGNSPSLSVGIYTLSAYFKPAGYSVIGLALWGGMGSWNGKVGCLFDVSAGTTLLVNSNNATAVSGRIAATGNGWYRCSVVINVTIAYNGNLRIQIRPDLVASSNFTGNGTSGGYAWGIQLEQGPFPTSYIPTLSSSVTRSSDIVSASLGSWYNQTEGAFLVQSSTDAAGVDIRPVSVSDGTNNNRMVMQRSTGNALLVFGSSAGTIIDFNSITGVATGAMNAAWAYRANDFRAAYNNQLPAARTNTVNPPAVTTLNIGNTGRYWLSRITYHPRRLPNSYLQSLTQ